LFERRRSFVPSSTTVSSLCSASFCSSSASCLFPVYLHSPFLFTFCLSASRTHHPTTLIQFAGSILHRARDEHDKQSTASSSYITHNTNSRWHKTSEYVGTHCPCWTGSGSYLADHMLLLRSPAMPPDLQLLHKMAPRVSNLLAPMRMPTDLLQTTVPKPH
jgi:hypothetical protein